ncbi:MAG: hypothetical protein AAGI48_12400 [Verrucomicrobiota bacterium]
MKSNDHSRPRGLFRTALLLAASSSCLQAAPIEFLAAEGFVDGDLNSQQGWIASTGGFLSNQVNATDGIVTSQNGEIAVFDTPVTMTVGQTYFFSATFEFVDFNASGLTPPAAMEFWYMARAGLKETNAATNVANGVGAATRFQALENDVRLLDNAFGGATTGLGSAVALDTSYTISYALILGADAASTVINVSLTDGVSTETGSIAGIETTLYDDITTGDGAYLFFQADSPVQGGINAIQLLTVDVGGVDPAPPESDVIDFLAVEGFVDGDLNGQQGWVASSGGFISNQVNSGAGLVASQNNEIAVYDVPVNMAVGDTYSFSATFRFADFDEGGLVPPATSEFWYMAKAGLKESNAATTVGSEVPGGATRLQALENDVRLLDNAFGAATAGLGSAVALATDYTVSYSLTLAADAASTNINVSLTDGVTTVDGVISGISTTLYDDIATGDGAYMFFQAEGTVQGGIEAIQLLQVDIGGVTSPPPGLTQFDFTAANGFADGDLDGQQGWLASTGGFISNQVNSTAGFVTSQNNEIAVYNVPVNLAVGETYTFDASFDFADFNESGVVPPGMSEFWYMAKAGLKETNDATTVANTVPAGATRFQAFEDNVRLLDNAFGGATLGTGSPVAVGTVYTISYSLTLGVDAASTDIEVSLSDGTTAVSGTINGISTTLYDDLATGDGAYMFFQAQGTVQGGIQAIRLRSVDITVPTGGSTPPAGIIITSITYEDGVGPTINYTSTVGPVDVYLNDTGGLAIEDFFLISSGETGGSYTDTGANTAKAFYILTPENQAP